MNVTQLQTSWDKFWYAPQSPLPVAAFRIAIGLIVINLCFLIGPNTAVLYGTDGLISNQTMAQWWNGTPQFSLFSYLPSDTATTEKLFLALLVSAVCLIVGLFSRVSAFAVFLILLSFDSRNHFVFHPAFALLRVMALYLSVSHCGDALSLDRIIKTRLGKKPPALSSPWAQRLMQLQLIAVYWASLSYQINGPAWLDGSAVYYATHLTEFQRFPLAPFLTQLECCKVIGWAVMLIEFALCTLIWVKEFRYIVLFLGLALHLSIEYSLVFIPLLQPLIIASYLLFIDPDDLSRAYAYIRTRLKQGNAIQCSAK
jgi:hypothetical protein